MGFGDCTFATGRCVERRARRHKAANAHVLTLNHLFIDVQMEWENIYSAHYADEEIVKKLHQLRRMHLEAENRNFSDGLALRKALYEQAKTEAAQYLQTTYGVK